MLAGARPDSAGALVLLPLMKRWPHGQARICSGGGAWA